MPKFLDSKAWLLAAVVSTLLLMALLALGQKKYNEQLEQKILGLSQTARENDIAAAATEEPDFGDASLFQGIEVRVQGLEIRGKWFSANGQNGVPRQQVGRLEHEPSRLTLDPDRPNRGYPDFTVQILPPRPFSDPTFLERLFSNKFQPPAFFDRMLKSSTKVGEFRWQSGGNSFLIEQHLLQFAIDVSTRYNEKKDYAGGEPPSRTDVFGDKMRNDWEWDSQRYPPIQIVLSFDAKSPEFGSQENPKKPRFAVAAAELISQKCAYAKKESAEHFGADPALAVGKLLPLYRSESSLPLPSFEQAGGARPQPYPASSVNDAASSFIGLKNRSKSEILNQDIFGKPRYSVITISNIGTITEGNLFIGKDKSSEYCRYVFALHQFVYGDWEARFKPASSWGKIDEYIQTEQQKPLVDRVFSGLIDGLIPSLGLGTFGKYLVLGLLALLLLPLFPAAIQIVAAIAGAVAKLLSLIAK